VTANQQTEFSQCDKHIAVSDSIMGVRFVHIPYGDSYMGNSNEAENITLHSMWYLELNTSASAICSIQWHVHSSHLAVF
jgi:hypothetical protein